MSVLNVMAFIPSLEQNSRLVGKSRSNEEERFRESLAKLLSSQGVEAVKVYEDVSTSRSFGRNSTDNIPPQARTDDATRAEAEKLWYQTLPLLIRFLEDPSDEVAASATPLLNDTMRLVSFDPWYSEPELSVAHHSTKKLAKQTRAHFSCHRTRQNSSRLC
jgi:hypothetical protein